jgi:hypothetical protein
MLSTSGVLAADAFPTSSTPSGPTEATTLPVLVANTSTVGVISVTPTFSWAIEAELTAKVKNANARIVLDWRKTLRVSKGLLLPGKSRHSTSCGAQKLHPAPI